MAKDKYILHIADHAHKTKTHDYNEDSKELLDDNVCRTDCRSRLPVGATEVDGNGGFFCTVAKVVRRNVTFCNKWIQNCHEHVINLYKDNYYLIIKSRTFSYLCIYA